MPERKTEHKISPERVTQRLVSDRKVRAVAHAGSFDTENAWVGSQPLIVTFERGLDIPQAEVRGGVTVQRFPYESLEDWHSWEKARQEAPLALLATSRVAYDPTGYFARIQRTLWNLGEAEGAAYRNEMIFQAEEALQAAVKAYTGPGHSAQQQLLALSEARDIALKLLYPALLTHVRAWPEFEIRLPHAWRAAAGLRFPKAVYQLDNLYGFGGEAEARRVLLATRGLGLVEEERRARIAFQAGYYDGAVRYLRDETARTHRHDLENWSFISSTRRDKLGTLLGVTRAPLGPAALDMVRDLIENVREGE